MVDIKCRPVTYFEVVGALVLGSVDENLILVDCVNRRLLGNIADTLSIII